MRKTALLGLASLAVANVTSAQSSVALDSFVVKENRISTPFSQQNRNIQILTNDQMKALPVRSVNELLSYADGVDLRLRGPLGTQADVGLDGSSFDQVVVLINGVKMSDPQTGHHLMNVPLPLSTIDHIEVLRGPAASKYGVNALTGAINIVTSMPVNDEVFAQAYAGSSLKTDSATGDTYHNWGAQASASISGKGHGHILSVAHDEGNGCRYNTAFEAHRLFYQNTIMLNNKNSIEAMGGYTNNKFGANAFYSAPGDVNSEEAVQTAIGSILYSFKPNERFSVKPRISYRYNSDDYVYIKQKPAVYRNFHETNVITGEVQSSLKLGKGNAGAGIEYRYEDIHSSNLGKHNRNNLGVYAEYRHEFSEKLTAGIAVYGNHNSEFGFKLYPAADAGYRLTKKLKLFASASTGQRLPTYTDLYYKGPANIGNSTLQPEFAKYAEGGGRYSMPFVFVQASYFYRNVTGFIDWIRTIDTDPWQPRNFQAINTQGVTLQANWNAGEQFFAGKFTSVWDASYTYLSPEIEKPSADISKYAVEALRHQFVITSRNVFFDRLTLNLAGRYQYRINANDYTILDARVGYTWRKFTVFADANNILDTQYKEAGVVPMPGRWYTFGMRFSVAANK